MRYKLRRKKPSKSRSPSELCSEEEVRECKHWLEAPNQQKYCPRYKSKIQMFVYLVGIPTEYVNTIQLKD